ncbi:PREDICTED: MATH domain and coiled-coil domain-containing protein At3g58440-like [Camelina sativa]|uniref:MATH domain and coiled-coil domain-containing protein At3g58440-like n=1 Tax=Camelina sativa TaxID=90675 RepID=A0ABM0TKI7_CAMSA|nr:PREDICTED: MATH domain and coiled-coil domain-containing protein At3g58440-like [Camelina sativa]
MASGLKMQFTWVLEKFSSLQDEEYRYSPPFTVAGCNWRLLAYPRGVMNDRSYGYFSVYLYLAPGSLPQGWRREVKYRITLVNVNPQCNKVLGEQCFLDAKVYISGFQEFLHLDQLRNKWEGFLVNDRLTIIAEVDVLPVNDVPLNSEPLKKILMASSLKSSDDDDDDDDASQEDGDDDDASQEDGDDDDASQEDKDVGGSGISPLNQLNGLEGLSHKEENHGCNTVVAETDQVSNGENDDAVLNEDVDDEVSSLVLNDIVARNASNIYKVLMSLEDASQRMETSVRGPKTLAPVVTETCDNVLMEIQPVKETVDINGFEVVSSKVESVRRIFERHPDIAVEFRAKNQHLRNACMNFLLSLIETMCQSLEELSNEDLVESDIALTYLRDAGFKVDWLEKKLDKLKEKKQEEQSGLARLNEIEENLMILEKKWEELDALADKEKIELKATRTALSFDDLV